MKKLITFLAISIITFQTTAQIRDWWEHPYPSIERPVMDMEFSNIPGIQENGLIFALPGNNGGLSYFTSPDSLNIYSIATNLGVISVEPDITNNRIFCAFGCGSNSDGLYKFDVATHEFSLITYSSPPNFVKKLSSYYYFGYGRGSSKGGLLHSSDGDEWTNIEFFNSKNVKDAEIDNYGRLFVAADNELFIQDEDTFNSVSLDLPINDIFVSSHLNNNSHDIFIACGNGSYSDCVYKVEYENGNINNLVFINNFIYPDKLYEYYGYLVVGCLNSGGLFLVDPVEMGEKHKIADFEDVYCFDTYPVYSQNIMVGTNNGVYYGGDFTINIKDLKNINDFINIYPNPVNDYIFIEKKLSEIRKIEIIDLLNSKKEIFKDFNNEKKIKLNLSSYSSGVYLLVIYSDKNKYQKKIIKL
ncbi:MAG: T9SS type A sorting domain-containing protein [Bacteroidales bacterium]|nr:T9SS type A sorting domain-containing protein [Bacteroidales bacterium]